MDTDDEPADDTAEPKIRRVTEAQWIEAKTQYEAGLMTKSALAEKYGVSRQAMGAGLNARGAVYASKTKMVEEAAVAAARDQTAKKIEEIDSFKVKQRKMIEMLQSLTVRAITDQVKDKKPIADAKPDIDTLRSAMNVLKVGRDEMYELWDLYRDPDGAEEIEEFIVSEYTPDEINALNKERLGIAFEVDDALAEVEASIEGGNSADDLDDLLGGP